MLLNNNSTFDFYFRPFGSDFYLEPTSSTSKDSLNFHTSSLNSTFCLEGVSSSNIYEMNCVNNNNKWSIFCIDFSTPNFFGKALKNNIWQSFGIHLPTPSSFWGNKQYNNMLQNSALITKASPVTPSHKLVDNKDVKALYDSMNLKSLGMDYKVFELAIEGYNNLDDKGNGYLGIFDITQSSDKERYYLIDMKNQKVITRSVMKEGSNKSATIAGANTNGSHSTVSGFVKVGADRTMQRKSTGTTCAKTVHGLEKGINDNALSKGILVHPSEYNTSWGCYAFPFVHKSNGSIDMNATKSRMDELTPEGTIIFTYPRNNVDEYKKLSALV